MKEVQHSEPIWIEKSDYVIRARVTDEEYSKKYDHEQLAVKELGNGKYEICCIPFFVYDLFLGDIVEIDRDYYVSAVVERSSYNGFRVATKDEVDQKHAVDQLSELSKLVERYSGRLVSVATPNDGIHQQMADMLQKLEDKKSILQYENIAT